MSLPCFYFDHDICRSCSEIQKPISEQLKTKEHLLTQALGLKPHQLLPTQSGDAFGFRNKVKLAVTGTLEAPILGLTGKMENLDLGRELLDCPVHHPVVNEVMKAIPKLIQKSRVEPYRIQERWGELKHIISYYSPHSREMYLRLILRSRESIERLQKNLPDWLNAFPFITCVSANLQPIPHAILEGPEEIPLFGKKEITHTVNHLTLSLAPRAFVQTNHLMAEKLYSTAAQWVKALSIKKMSELFCGQGAFSFHCQEFIDEGLGFEINPDAVATANETAKRLSLNHLHFKTAAAADLENELNAFKPDVVLVNPPRKGLGEAVKYLNRSTHPYLIYSSCSYETLATDLNSFSDYTVIQAQIFDLFPHTTHFETLVLLRHSSQDS